MRWTLPVLLVLSLLAVTAGACCRKNLLGHEERKPVEGPVNPAVSPDASADAAPEAGVSGPAGGGGRRPGR
jgi:hypothetical protein